MNNYYNVSKIYQPETHPAEFYISVGGRNNGKSTAWEFPLIDEFFQKGYTFGKIIRRGFIGEDDILLQWFTPPAQKYIKKKYNHYIICERQKFYVVPIDNEYLPIEKGQRVARKNKKFFGQHFVLALENKYKSLDFTYINTLVFEEFALIEDSGYLPNEVEHFLSLVSTINRDRNNLKIVMIGNTIKKNNPYFDMLGIDNNKLKMKAGMLVDLICKDYIDGARIRYEFAESCYKRESDAPRILKIGNNDVAISGDYSISDYVVPEEFDEFINKECNINANFVIRTNNKNYYHLTCIYKNYTFNFITSRCKQYKCKGNIFNIDLKIIECIKTGCYSKIDLLKRIEEYLIYDTLFSDDDIEYKYKKMFKIK